MYIQIRRLSLIFLAMILSAQAFSQKRLIRKADDSFEVGEYYEAYEMYEKAYEKLKSREEKQKAHVAFRLGECCRITNDARKAKRWYRYAVRYEYKEPEAVLYYAQALFMLEDYEDAKPEFEKYTKLKPDDPRGHNGLKAVELVMDWRENPTRHIVKEAEDINSSDNDYAPSYGRSSSELYFTSTREEATGDNTSSINGMPYPDIFFAVKDNKGKWSTPVPAPGLINTEGSEGVPHIINDGAIMYYTYCKQAEGENRGCKIFKSKKSTDGWGQAELVDIFGDSSITVAHPAVTEDELTLYFVSDKKGGIGGKDIWVCKRTSATGEWGRAENLGKPVNTPGNEMFPFIRQNGELYFSSDGHIGAGGLDIFKTEKKDGKRVVENMKFPINSPADDFGIIFYQDKDEGYFSSTREREDNLYRFRLPAIKFTLKGLVVNSETGQPLPGANVKLVSTGGDESEISSASDGTFVFRLTENMDYTITAKRDEFLASYKNLSTRGVKESREFNVKLELKPIKGTFELPNIEYDFGEATLRPESYAALDELVEILTVNSNITIALVANTDFRGSEEANQDLSQRRAQSVVDYLLEKGIEKERLTPVGKGESKPKRVSADTDNGREILKKYDFIKDGDVLTEEYINNLETEEQKEICHQINRRTEFEVLRDDYGLGNAKGFGTEE